MKIDFNIAQGLNQNIDDFKAKLDTLEDILIRGDFTYGCCGKPIEKASSDIRNEETCPHCLDFYKSKKEISNGYGWSNPIRAFISSSLNESGEQMYSSSDEKILATMPELEAKYGEFEFVGKRKRVRFNNQRDFDVVANILFMITEMPNGYYGGNDYIPRLEMRETETFGGPELDYINDHGLAADFSFIMTAKQILINQILIDTTNRILTKIGNAGMALL